MKKWLACMLVFSAGCPDVKLDTDEVRGPTVEFDPANRIIPFPNNLLLDPMTGKVTLPAQCNETAATKATREGAINQLDGFGTFETAMTVTLTEPVDVASLTPDTVVMYKLAAGGMPVDPATSMQIPIARVIPGETARFADVTTNPDGSLSCENPSNVTQVTFVPGIPLDQRSTYVVALLTGVKTATGENFGASGSWALVRQPENPVTLDTSGNIVSERTPLDPASPEDNNGNGVGDDLESILGIHRLWTVHAPAFTFLGAKGKNRDDVLLAWTFNTQTTTDPLDPTVAGSPAAMTPTTPFGAMIHLSMEAANRANLPYKVCSDGTTNSLPEANDTQCFLKMAIGGGRGCTVQAVCDAAYDAGTAACASLGCAAIADVYVGLLGAPQYQTERPNMFDTTKPVPGPWADPLAPQMVKNEGIQALVMIPAGATPAGGWPTAVFQHGLGQSKTNVFAIAPGLARDPDGPAGPLVPFATVAIDAVAHDSRAIRISSDAARGCDGTPTTATAPQCFASFLSPDLGTTRDNIRQTVLDQQRLVAALKACGTAACAPLAVDTTHIVYAGQSLGGIMGSVTAAVVPDIRASVLNVPGVGWADILENTQTLAIRCTLVDGLIDAGILQGDKLNPMASPPTGLCTTDAWKMQPGYRTFSAIGRWVLDPADPANFTRKLAARRFLIQEVVGDTVVPNLATDNGGALVGLGMGADASCGVPTGTPPAIQPSAAIVMNPMANKFLKYRTVAPGTATCPPGNTFNHGSLLRPAPSATGGTCNLVTGAGCDGSFATARMQTDAITYLHINK